MSSRGDRLPIPSIGPIAIGLRDAIKAAASTPFGDKDPPRPDRHSPNPY